MKPLHKRNRQPAAMLQNLEPRLLLSGESVAYQVAVTDLNDSALTAVETGQQFRVSVYTQDLRDDAQGVFAAYLDLTYDALVNPTGGFVYGDDYINGHSGDNNTAGLFNEVGGFADVAPLGGDPVLVFSRTFQADVPGTFSFAANVADVTPAHCTLVYGSDDPVTVGSIAFGSTSLQVLAASQPTATLADPIDGDTVLVTNLNGKHYIDVTFSDAGVGIAPSAITDAGAEFTLGGDGAAETTVNGDATLVSGTTYRYAIVGDFAAGEVTVNFIAGSFADLAGHTNVADSQGFTVAAADNTRPVVTLADPANGTNIVETIINGRHYVDVTFSDAGGAGLDLSTITDADAEITLGGAAATDVIVDGVPTLVSGTTYRYGLTGDFGRGQVTVNFVAGAFADGAGNINLQSDQTFTVIAGTLAVNDTATVAEDALATAIDVLANDSAAPGGTLSVTGVGAVAHGTALLVGGQVRYTPDANFNGTDTFTYTVSDGLGGTDTGAVSVTVTPVNDTPTANDQNVTTNENTDIAITLAGNDVETDLSDRIYTIVAQPTHGTLISQGGAQFLYSPDRNFNGVDTFTFTVTDTGDPDGGDQGWGFSAASTSLVATVQITVGYRLVILNSVGQTFTDADGDLVTVLLKGGAGVLCFSHGPVAGVLPDATGMSITGTNAKSQLTITTKATTKGKLAGTSLQYIDVAGPLAKFVAATTAIVGNADGEAEELNFNNAVGSLVLGDITGNHVLTVGARAAGDTKTLFSLTAGRVDELSIQSAAPVGTISVVNWLDGDGVDDTITATTIATIKTGGKKATKTAPAIQGDFQADVIANTLANFLIAGGLDGSTVTANGTDAKGQSIAKFSAGIVADASVVANKAIGSIFTSAWDSGVITANSVGSLTTKANVALGGDGSFGADLTLAGAGLTTKQFTLGTASIAGSLNGVRWNIQNGNVKSITVTQTARNSVVGAAGNISKLQIGQSDGSDFGAGVDYDLLVNDRHLDGGDAAPTGTIAMFTVKGWKLVKGQPVPQFFIDSNISARVGTVNMLNWDGLGGLFTSGDGSLAKNLKYKDTDAIPNAFIWPDDFVHVI